MFLHLPGMVDLKNIQSCFCSLTIYFLRKNNSYSIHTTTTTYTDRFGITSMFVVCPLPMIVLSHATISVFVCKEKEDAGNQKITNTPLLSYG